MRKFQDIKLNKLIYLMFSVIIALIIIVLIVSAQIISNLNKELYLENSKRISEKLMADVNSYFESINEAGNIFAYNQYIYKFSIAENTAERLRSFNYISPNIGSILSMNRNVNCAFYTDNNVLFMSNSEFYNDYYKVFDRLKNLDYDHDNFDCIKMIDEQDGSLIKYYIVKQSFYDMYTDKKLYIVFSINIEALKDIVNSIDSEQSVFVILDETNDIVASNSSMSNSILTPEYISGEIKDGQTPEDIFTQFTEIEFNSSDISRVNWKIISAIDVTKVDSIARGSIIILFVLGVFLVVIVFLFVYFIRLYIINPITQISFFAAGIGNDYKTTRLDMKNENEVGFLANKINRMLDNIHKLNTEKDEALHKLYMTDISKKHAKYVALQSQINPHFLYNSLDCIQGMAYSKGIKSIAEMAGFISSILRYSIKEVDYVKLNEEINSIKEYMEIIMIRHDKRFTALYSLDPESLNMYIPKMILQPLVENAVFHGLEPRRGQGHILLSSFINRKNKNELTLVVVDNGCGMSEENLQSLRSALNESVIYDEQIFDKKSIGIFNIYQRLKLIYDQNCSLTIESSLNQGTKITIKINGVSTTNPNGLGKDFAEFSQL